MAPQAAVQEVRHTNHANEALHTSAPNHTTPHPYPLSIPPHSDHDDPANLYCAPHPKIDIVALREYHHTRWRHRLPLNFSYDTEDDREEHSGGRRERRKRMTRKRYADVDWVLELSPRDEMTA